MFELIADGTVDEITNKIKNKGFPVGIGGMSKLGTGELPADLILAEHYRLKSNGVILSRGFTDGIDISSYDSIKKHFETNVKKIREKERILVNESNTFFSESHERLKNKVMQIIK